jgi:hypothetical protein
MLSYDGLGRPGEGRAGAHFFVKSTPQGPPGQRLLVPMFASFLAVLLPHPEGRFSQRSTRRLRRSWRRTARELASVSKRIGVLDHERRALIDRYAGIRSRATST